MILERFYEDQLAQASYLAGCAVTGEAIVIDPNRHVDRYTDATKARGVRITAVTETHIHADFASGARALAERLGARLYLSDEGGPDWQYQFAHEPLRNGDEIRIGTIRLDVLHTPGHTPEHLTFLLTGEAASPEPLGAFTGDFIFVGDVGRPDLLERAAGMQGTMESGARQLYASLREFAKHPDHILIWPGHGAGSACGKRLSGVPASSLGYEKLSNWAFFLDEDRFVKTVLDGQPDPPKYFAQMKRLNRLGVPAWSSSPLKRLDPALPRSGTLIDLRATKEFTQGFVPGSIGVPLGRSFVTWAGSVLPYGEPLAFVAHNAAQAEAAARDLALIGLDDIAGWYAADSLAETSRMKQVDAAGIAKGATVIDVRTVDEYAAGHIPGALNYPLPRLQQCVKELSRDTPVVVHCQGGARSPIAASVMLNMGFKDVADLAGGYAAFRAANPVGAVKAGGS